VKHSGITIIILALATSNAFAFLLPDSVDHEAWSLTTAYLRYGLVQQTASQALQLAAQDEALAAEVGELAEQWSKIGKQRIRRNLTTAFGDESQQRFAAFVDEFVSAEGRRDTEFLASLSEDLALPGSAATDYATFRMAVFNEYLSNELKMSADRLGEVQTWIGLKTIKPETPPLKTWMRQVSHVQRVKIESPKPEQAPPKPMTELERLAAMEEPLGEYEAPTGSVPSVICSMKGKSAHRRRVVKVWPA